MSQLAALVVLLHVAGAVVGSGHRPIASRLTRIKFEAWADADFSIGADVLAACVRFQFYYRFVWLRGAF